MLLNHEKVDFLHLPTPIEYLPRLSANVKQFRHLMIVKASCLRLRFFLLFLLLMEVPPTATGSPHGCLYR